MMQAIDDPSINEHLKAHVQLCGHDVAVDCLVTAVAMRADNYFLAQPMHGATAKESPFRMAEQHATVSTWWAQYLTDHKECVSRAVR